MLKPGGLQLNICLVWGGGGRGDTSYPALSVNDNFIVSNKEKASTFNDFFLSQSRINTPNADLPPVTPTPVGIDSIQATESEVLDLVLSLDCTKSAGPDGISPKLLRLAGYMIVPSLTKLFNESFGSEKVPKLWKEANITPLHKKGNNLGRCQ